MTTTDDLRRLVKAYRGKDNMNELAAAIAEVDIFDMAEALLEIRELADQEIERAGHLGTARVDRWGRKWRHLLLANNVRAILDKLETSNAAQ